MCQGLTLVHGCIAYLYLHTNLRWRLVGFLC
jgi:hypothetical protein